MCRQSFIKAGTKEDSSRVMECTDIYFILYIIYSRLRFCKQAKHQSVFEVLRCFVSYLKVFGKKRCFKLNQRCPILVLEIYHPKASCGELFKAVDLQDQG